MEKEQTVQLVRKIAADAATPIIEAFEYEWNPEDGLSPCLEALVCCGAVVFTHLIGIMIDRGQLEKDEEALQQMSYKLSTILANRVFEELGDAVPLRYLTPSPEGANNNVAQ